MLGIIFSKFAPKLLKTYLISIFSGAIKTENFYLLKQGLNILRNNLWLPLIFYLLGLPDAVINYINIYRLYHNIPPFMHKNLGDYTFLMEWLNKIFNSISHIFWIDYSLYKILPLALITIAMFYALYIILINDGKPYKISSQKRIFFIIIIVIFILSAMPILNLYYNIIIIRGNISSHIAEIFFAIIAPGLNGFILPPLSEALVIIIMAHKILKLKLSQNSFGQALIDSFVPIFYMSLIFYSFQLLLNLPSSIRGIHILFSPNDEYFPITYPIYLTYFHTIVMTLLTYFFMPFSAIVILHRTNFRKTVKIIGTWHRLYPEKLGGFILLSWLLCFLVTIILDVVIFIANQVSILWLNVLCWELSEIIHIAISCWLLICLVKLSKELIEQDLAKILGRSHNSG